jgi:hypothetical protein
MKKWKDRIGIIKTLFFRELTQCTNHQSNEYLNVISEDNKLYIYFYNFLKPKKKKEKRRGSRKKEKEKVQTWPSILWWWI